MFAFVRALLAVLLVLPMLAAAAPLRVVVDQNYPPFILRNARGELEGYSVDLWRLWQQKTWVQVELRGVSDGSDKVLTEAIVDLAHRLGIEAIAEGVESIAQRDALAAMGCDYIQGYYYSQAVSREIFEKLLERQHAH